MRFPLPFLTLAFATLTFAQTAQAQSGQDIVRLKDGTELFGKIIERKPEGTVRLFQADGTTRTITASELGGPTTVYVNPGHPAGIPSASTMPLATQPKVSFLSELGLHFPVDLDQVPGLLISTTALFRVGQKLSVGPGLGYLISDESSVQLYGRGRYLFSNERRASPFIAADHSLAAASSTNYDYQWGGYQTRKNTSVGPHTALHFGVQVRPARAGVGFAASMGYTYTHLPSYVSTYDDQGYYTGDREQQHPGFFGVRLGITY